MGGIKKGHESFLIALTTYEDLIKNVERVEEQNGV